MSEQKQPVEYQSKPDEVSLETLSSEKQLSNLSNLHRMSRTAGLGSTEYAAVNVPAVITCVIGLASTLAFVTPIFLFIPVVGLMIGIIAIKQLRDSNGTQTGMLWAVIGLVACVTFSALSGYKLLNDQIRQEEGDRIKTQLVEDFGKYLMSSDYDKAYQILDPRFRDRVKIDRFKDFFEKTMIPAVGKIKSLKSNAIYVEDEATDDPSIRMAGSKMLLDAERIPGGQPIRYDIFFRYSGVQWTIYSIPQWFPVEKSAPTQQVNPGPAGPPG